MEKIGVLNVRNVPKQVVLNFKGRAAIAGFSMQEAVVLLLKAVGDGRIKLEKLAKKEDV